jgi:predicted nucleic-acid-binding protein
MKGLDTNLLVRYLVKDEPKQAEKAIAYIQKVVASGENCFINHLVLCELVWVLESAYGYKKKQIADVLQKLLMTKQFEIELKDTARRAINEYSQGNGDLADYLIGNINHLNGCDVTATFDHDLKDCQSFILLE